MCLLVCTQAAGQVIERNEPSTRRDTILPGRDSLPADSTTLSAQDSLPLDSAIVDLQNLRISNDALDDIVDYGARDSMWLDVANKQLHLYGGAYVKYTSIDLKAGSILLDFGKSEVLAEQIRDSSGTLVELPEFKDRDQAFTALRLRYNFKTKKGLIYEARTQQEDLYVLGEKAKFVGGGGGDTTRTDNTIYNQDALITTCDAPHPHYGIHTNKLKVIPDKLVVTGLSNLEIGGVPMPLVLPFGFYPITKTRKAGVLIPRDFNFRQAEGLGIRDFGWYQPFGEHVDLTVLFNAYASGSWGARSTARYNQLYKYNGDFTLDFNKRVTEGSRAEKIRQRSFGIDWTHTQDPKAHPTRSFGGSVHIETNRNQNRNYNDFASVHQNLRSNLNYSQRFPGKPFSLTAGLTHSQNIQTRQMDIQLPNATFNVQRVFPFKRKNPEDSRERWYEKLSLTYSARLLNALHTVDTALFTEQTLRTAQIGLQHQASTDYTFKLFKYINVAPRISYEENWYPYKIEKALNTNTFITCYDTLDIGNGQILITPDPNCIRYGRIDTTRTWGFNAFRTYNAGINTNTALFLTKQFRRGWLRGIRHKVTPSASIGFGPDFSHSRYFKTVYTDTRPEVRQLQTYSIFDEGPFGKPSLSQPNVVLSYGLGNQLEFKHFSARRDTVLKKKIFDNLTFSGSYSLTADSLKFSPITTGGVFRFFKGFTTLNWNLGLDPYVLTERGVRVNRFLNKEEGRLLRVSSFGFSINTGFTIARLREVFRPKTAAEEAAGKGGKTSGAPNRDDFLGWFERFNISHNINFSRAYISGTNRDTFLITTNSLNLSGNIPLTAKWTINLDHIGYDFPTKKITYPSFGLTRDLHCWEMRLSWQPTRGTYEFYINVKPGSLDFLKVPYRKSNVDVLYGY